MAVATDHAQQLRNATGKSVAGTRAFQAIVCVCLLVGIYARVRLYATNDPLGVNDDLMGTMAVWRDLTGNELGRAPSNRVGEFGLSITLGVISSAFSLDPAHSIGLLAFACSLGLLGAAPFFITSLGGGRLTAAAFLAAIALAPAAIQETLTANSTSPFLLFAALGTSCLILFWRRGGVFWIVAGVLMFGYAMSIRGTGLLHVGPLWVALVSGRLLSPAGQRAPWRRLMHVTLGLMAMVAIVSAAKGYVNHRITANYARRDGRAPAAQPYFTYVLYDGIMGGPYMTNTEGWKTRQRVRKDPALRAQDPIQRGDSALKIIRDNRGQYARNYVLGAWMTLQKSFCERRLNLLGWIPMLLGLAWLLSRRRWLETLMLAGWVSVYMLIQPLIAIVDRTVWPIAFGLGAFGAYFFGCMLELCLEDDRPRAQWLRRAGLATIACCFVYLCATATTCADTRYLDYRREARSHIADEQGRRIRLLSPSVTICNYGASLDYIQMAPTGDKAAQSRLITAQRPDYVFFPGMSDTSWDGAYEAIKDVLVADGDAHWTRTWTNGKAELWGKTSGESAATGASAAFLTIDETTDPSLLKCNLSLTVTAEQGGLLLNCNGNDPIIFLPQIEIPATIAPTVQVEISSPEACVLKVYFKTDPAQKWAEERCVKKSLSTGENKVSLPLPPNAIGTLRFDPGDKAGQYHLKKLVVSSRPAGANAI